jgi:hypothetical protein
VHPAIDASTPGVVLGAAGVVVLGIDQDQCRAQSVPFRQGWNVLAKISKYFRSCSQRSAGTLQ